MIFLNTNRVLAIIWTIVGVVLILILGTYFFKIMLPSLLSQSADLENAKKSQTQAGQMGGTTGPTGSQQPGGSGSTGTGGSTGTAGSGGSAGGTRSAGSATGGSGGQGGNSQVLPNVNATVPSVAVPTVVVPTVPPLPGL